MVQIKKILCPVDFSECSMRAWAYALELGKLTGGSIEMLHVVQTPLYGTVGLDLDAAAAALDMDQIQESCTEKLEELAEKARSTYDRVTTLLTTGVPFLEIIRVAREHEVDLLVMGTHGRAGLAHVLIGSVAERVVRKAPCPVLTVKHPEHEFITP